MKIRYEITHVDNASELDAYVPVTGRWLARLGEDDGTCHKFPAGTAVVETVCNWMNVDFAISVRLYHADGREITGDMPWEGTFVATRN